VRARRPPRRASALATSAAPNADQRWLTTRGLDRSMAAQLIRTLAAARRPTYSREYFEQPLARTTS
jgi:hypothetical protein